MRPPEPAPEIQGPPSPRAWLAAHRLRWTPKTILVVSVIVALVLVVSGLLARWLQVENTERDDDLAVLEAQVHGDAQGMLSRLSGCREQPSCLAAVQANARNPRLVRSGAVKILQLESDTAYSLTGATGKTRVAWTVLGKLPVVQCVEVRRSGNPISGIKVTLLSLSEPIPNEGEC